MVPVKYIEAVRRLLDDLEKTQLDAVEKAADLVAAALAGGNAVFCGAVGHGNEGDWLNRAGGLAALQRFSYSAAVSAPVAERLKNRPRPGGPIDETAERVRFALKTGNLRAGDVLILSSVSGKNREPIEMALACREMGIKVIGLTSMAYTANVKSAHPSGKKLFEAVDVAIDIRAPYGDAAVDVPGFDVKLLPVSGVAMTVIGWMIWGRVMEKMAAAGTPPSVFMSVNREGGQEFYEQSLKRWNEKGY